MTKLRKNLNLILWYRSLKATTCQIHLGYFNMTGRFFTEKNKTYHVPGTRNIHKLK